MPGQTVKRDTRHKAEHSAFFHCCRIPAKQEKSCMPEDCPAHGTALRLALRICVHYHQVGQLEQVVDIKNPRGVFRLRVMRLYMPEQPLRIPD